MVSFVISLLMACSSNEPATTTATGGPSSSTGITNTSGPTGLTTTETSGQTGHTTTSVQTGLTTTDTSVQTGHTGTTATVPVAPTLLCDGYSTPFDGLSVPLITGVRLTSTDSRLEFASASDQDGDGAAELIVQRTHIYTGSPGGSGATTTGPAPTMDLLVFSPPYVSADVESAKVATVLMSGSLVGRPTLVADITGDGSGNLLIKGSSSTIITTIPSYGEHSLDFLEPVSEIVLGKVGPTLSGGVVDVDGDGLLDLVGGDEIAFGGSFSPVEPYYPTEHPATATTLLWGVGAYPESAYEVSIEGERQLLIEEPANGAAFISLPLSQSSTIDLTTMVRTEPATGVSVLATGPMGGVSDLILLEHSGDHQLQAILGRKLDDTESLRDSADWAVCSMEYHLGEVALADMNQDGVNDLVATFAGSGQTSVTGIFHGPLAPGVFGLADADQSFRTASTVEGCVGLTVADMDGDGANDVVLAGLCMVEPDGSVPTSEGTAMIIVNNNEIYP